MTITVGGVTVPNAFNPQYQKSISELGQSGISVSTLSFDTIAPFIADTADTVVCDLVSGITFYVNQRTKSGKVVHVEALDAAAFLDQEIQLENQDINHVVDQTGKVIGDFVSAATIADKIRTNCKGMIASVPWTPTQYGFPFDYVQGKTFQQILTDISEVCAGFYTMISGDILTLKYLNEMDEVSGRAHHSITYHSAVNVNGDFHYDSIAVQSSYETAYIGSNLATDYNTLTINNPLSDYVFPVYDAVKPGTDEHYAHVDTTVTPDELAHIVSETYQGWTCDNVVIGSLYPLGDYCDFATGEELRITDMSVRFIGGVMLASLGGGIPTSGEISRRPRRQIELDNKLTLGETVKNLSIAPYSGFSYYEQAQSSSGGGS